MTDTSDGEGGKQWDWMNALGGRMPRMDECPSRGQVDSRGRVAGEWTRRILLLRPEGLNYYCYCNSMPAGESHALPVSEECRQADEESFLS